MKPFNMRYVSLENFPHNDRKCSNRVAAINRFRDEYPINCPFKSINLLRQFLQTKINQEIRDILQKYRQTFLEPVFTNVRQNLRNNELANELDINAIMHQVLDEAKKMFPLENDKMLAKLRQQEQDNDCGKDRQPNHHHNSNNNNQQTSTVLNSSGRPRGRPKLNRTVLKTKAKRKRNKTIISISNANHNLVTIDNDATDNSTLKNKLIDDNEGKWDPSRLSTKTLVCLKITITVLINLLSLSLKQFVLGSKANKALGFGAARGRLYSKHANLFRYIGDHEDKEWLHRNQLMPTTGGKAYLLVRDDIIELLNSDEYRETPGVDIDEMGEGFTVPQSMIDKISTTMRMTGMKNHSINQQSHKSSAINDQRIKIHTESISAVNTTEYDNSGHLFDNDDNNDFDNISAEDDDDDDDEQDKDFTI